MDLSPRVKEAAERILQGDQATIAAQHLEAAILDEYLGDENFEDLVYALSMYAPLSGAPYYTYADLVREINSMLREVSGW
jgi:hypothetical protein